MVSPIMMRLFCSAEVQTQHKWVEPRLPRCTPYLCTPSMQMYRSMRMMSFRKTRREILLDSFGIAMAPAFLPWRTRADTQLPKEYVETSHALIDALRETIELDLSGASELEVRRRAEPAKDLVKKFINNWSDAVVVRDETSCQEIRAAVQELGKFYSQNGQRKRLTDSVATSLLGHLDAAKGSLPEREEKKNLLPF